MKSLYESLLDDEDDILKNQDKNIKASIKQFLKDNYKGGYRISRKPNENGKFVVDCNRSLRVINKSITSLTNGYFVFGEIEEGFGCSDCNSLTSLEGAPEKVGGSFYCYHCDSLTSLEDVPNQLKGKIIK